MDIKKIRKDTIGCEDKLFFNSAGSSLPPIPVVEKMTEYLQYEEQVGGYEAAKKRADEIETFYSETAKLLNCEASNVAFAYNATDAYARALSAIPFEKGDYLLTSNDDYISNQIAFLSLQKRFGINILRADNLSNGDIDLMQFEELIKRHSPTLVAITHIPTNSGLVQNVEEIGRFCKEYNIWYLVDACQSVGQLNVDVEKIGCDFLSATGRKFLRGPRGTGFLYVSDNALKEGLEPLFIDMRGADWITADEYKMRTDAKRFEMWEFSYATVIGLAVAIRYANEIGIDNIQSYNVPLVQSLRDGLASIENIRVLDMGSSKSNIVTFNKNNIKPGEMEQILKDENIYFSVSLKQNAIIDFTKKEVDWAIRFSPHYFNTEDEVKKVVEIIRSV